MAILNPFSLPVHPPLVHFPIAMLTLTWGCLVLRYLTGNLRWDARARQFQAIAVFSLPFVLIAALIDTQGFRFLIHARWRAPLVWHALAGVLVTALTASHFFWRRRYSAEQLNGRLAIRDLVMASLTVWVLVAVGLIAAEMVFAA